MVLEKEEEVTAAAMAAAMAAEEVMVVEERVVAEGKATWVMGEEEKAVAVKAVASWAAGTAAARAPRGANYLIQMGHSAEMG